MIAYVVLLLAAISRLLPHALHGVGINFTAVGAGLLFFGSRRPRWEAAAAAAAAMALTDIYLTTRVYGLAFHLRGYLVTWCWYGAVALLASGLLRKVTIFRIAAGVFASATGFFLLVDFALWAGTNMYPHTAAGLLDCYVKALPFYGNDLVSTGLVSAVLFGVPVVAARMAEAIRAAQPKHQPLA